MGYALVWLLLDQLRRRFAIRGVNAVELDISTSGIPAWGGGRGEHSNADLLTHLVPP